MVGCGDCSPKGVFPGSKPFQATLEEISQAPQVPNRRAASERSERSEHHIWTGATLRSRVDLLSRVARLANCRGKRRVIYMWRIIQYIKSLFDFDARRRQIDMAILWPSCVEQADNIGHAKAAFACHIFNDSAWNKHYTEDELFIFIDTLDASSASS